MVGKISQNGSLSTKKYLKKEWRLMSRSILPEKQSKKKLGKMHIPKCSLYKRGYRETSQVGKDG